MKKRITSLKPIARHPRRQMLYLDGRRAFWVYDNVRQKLKLEVGRELDEAQLIELHEEQLRQMCFDRAVKIIARRAHSAAQVTRLLERSGFTPRMVQRVLKDLKRLGYANDEQLAADVAQQRRNVGRLKVLSDLSRAGVSDTIAETAVGRTHTAANDLASARALTEKHLPRLKSLDATTGRRRLTGVLARRGFDEDVVQEVVEEQFPLE